VLCGAPIAVSAEASPTLSAATSRPIVRSYLIAHPEVLEEAMSELSKRQAATEQKKHEASIAQNADTIFNSPRGVVLGNKDGDVTFVEFFRLQLRLLQTRHGRHARSHEERSEAEGRAEGISGAERRFRSMPRRSRSPFACRTRAERNISTSPEAARAAAGRRQGARAGRSKGRRP